jgi:hypothetical protein
MINPHLARAALIGWLGLSVVACDGQTSRSPMTPVAPTPVSATPIPAPVAAEFIAIEVNEVVRRTAINPPLCVGEPAWPCQYFRITAPSTGYLEISLIFDSSTQGKQGVDISARDLLAGGGIDPYWAEFGNSTQTRLMLPMTAGRTYQITLWYTYEKLQYELRASLKPPPA